jgi:hypothetical protein
MTRSGVTEAVSIFDGPVKETVDGRRDYGEETICRRLVSPMGWRSSLYYTPRLNNRRIISARELVNVKERIIIRRSPGDARRGKTDWARLASLTERELIEEAKSDLDAQPTDDEFWRNARIVMPERKV